MLKIRLLVLVSTLIFSIHHVYSIDCDINDGSATFCPEIHRRGFEDLDEVGEIYHNCQFRRNTEDECELCPAGSVCNGMVQYFCEAGSYSSLTGKFGNDGSSCNPCEQSNGKYCPEGSDQELNCPAGDICADDTKTKTACGSGSYCPEGTHGVIEPECPVGSYCSNPSTMEDCAHDMGYYCPPGSTSGYETCDPGELCTCDTEGKMTCTGTGTYCPGGSKIGNCGFSEPVCPAGSYCTNPSTIFDCTHNNGNWCPPGTSTANPKCTVGYICSADTELRTQCTDVGAYCPLGTWGSNEPLCQAGFYCSTPSSTPVACEHSNGRYCPEGSVTEELCPLGWMCSEDTETGAACTVEGAYCPIGTWGTTEPLCPVGQKCTTPSSTPVDCQHDNGYFCPAGSTIEETCSLGEICACDTESKITCSGAGVYCPGGSGSGNCGDTPPPCPVGKFCSAPTAATDCTHSVGFYCPAGTGPAAGLCPVGSICGANTETINTCVDTGAYCPEGTWGTTEPQCPAGSYCPNPSTRTLCPDGTYSTTTGATDVSTCQDCDEGYYCQGGSTDPQQNPCQYSYYCPAGTGTEVVCNCAMHGTCTPGDSIDDCDCEPTYGGTQCDDYTCFTKAAMGGEACDKHGVCSAIDVCTCFEGYKGVQCDYWFCNDTMYNHTATVCSGRGTCESPDKCDCPLGWGGDICELAVTVDGDGIGASEIVLIAGGITIGVICVILFALVMISILLVLIILIFRVSSNKMKGDSNPIKEMDDIDDIQKEESNKFFANLEIDKKLFNIDIDDLKVKRSIGKGAFATVYEALYYDKKVAYKVFNTTYLGSTQNDFEMFEKELKLFSSLSHPNIVSFYGAVLKPPRCGIVMELCEQGDLQNYINECSKSKEKLSLSGKVKILCEIASAMMFIHKKNILHRDLKPENVLMAKGVPKLVDFGVSKFVGDRNVSQTSSVGTSYYMAPEVVTSTTYGPKIDVFSFSILLFVVLSENFTPYGENSTFKIEFKVANDENFRPSKDLLSEEVLKIENKWLVNLMEKNWSGKPEERDTFEVIYNTLKKK